jgi:hypothetical protein
VTMLGWMAAVHLFAGEHAPHRIWPPASFDVARVLLRCNGGPPRRFRCAMCGTVQTVRDPVHNSR